MNATETMRLEDGRTLPLLHGDGFRYLGANFGRFDRAGTSVGRDLEGRPVFRSCHSGTYWIGAWCRDGRGGDYYPLGAFMFPTLGDALLYAEWRATS